MRDIDPDDPKQQLIVSDWIHTQARVPANLLRELRDHLDRPEPRYYATQHNGLDMPEVRSKEWGGRGHYVVARCADSADASRIADLLNAAEATP